MGEKGHRDLHILLAVLVFIIYLVWDSIHITHATALIEALLAGGITFIGLQLDVAHRALALVSTAVEDLKTLSIDVKRIGVELEKGRAELETGRGELQGVATALRPIASTLQGAADELKDGMNLTIDILKRIPKLDAITQGLETPDSLAIGDRVTRSFEGYAVAWCSSAAAALGPKPNPMIAHAWSQFLQAYLQDQSKMISCASSVLPCGEVRVHSRTYTNIVVECCNALATLRPDEDVTVLLVTGMMPDEFYNWPQAEYASNSPYLRYLAHTWDGAQEYFRQLGGLKNRIKVQRCLLLQASSGHPLGGNRFPWLHSYAELEEIGGLHIYDQTLSFSQLKDLGMSSMLDRITKIVPKADPEIHQFIRLGEFKFYPIGTSDEFELTSVRPTSRLLELYIGDLHTSPDDAMCRLLNSPADDFLIDALGQSDLMPEWALLKSSKRGEETDWLFAIKGYLEPFTETMSVQFIAGAALERLRIPFHSLTTGSVRLTAQGG